MNDRATDAPVPVTLLTGFLGAGKTTLLNRLLAGTAAQRIFVIENEFGPVNIDADLLISDRADIIEMTGGCLCCTIRGDLTIHLTDILARRRAGELHFERLVIETTGLADPTPIVQTFFGEPEVAAGYLLDAVLVVVDAVHAQDQLDRHAVAQKQVGFADRLLISKTDLVDSARLDALSARLAAINPGARQHVVERGAAAAGDLLDIRGFNLRDEDSRASRTAYRPAPQGGGGILPRHRDEIAAVLLEHDGAMDLERVGEFMLDVLDTLGDRLLRYKGVLAVAGDPRRLILQGVHRLAGFDYGRPWRADEPARSRIVLIGSNLPAADLQARFRAAAAGTAALSSSRAEAGRDAVAA